MAETTSPNGLLGRATRGAARGVVGGVKRRRATRKYYKAVSSEAVATAKRKDAETRRRELSDAKREARARRQEEARERSELKQRQRERERQADRQARDERRREAEDRRGREREQAKREKEERERRREAERAEQKRRQQLLAEQASRKREQKIARAERESIGGGGLLDSQRRSVAARSRRRPLNISSLEEAYGMTNPSQPLFCADCDAPGNGKLRRQKDGRFICATCERRNKDKGSRRRQPTLFNDEGREQSTSLFDAAGNPAQLQPSADKPVKVEGYCLPTHYRAKPSPRGTKAGAREKAATDRKPKHRTKTEARKAKSAVKKATRATRGTKKALTDLSLSQFVRRMGGIAPARDREDAGELRYLGQKEGKTTGLLNKNSRYSAEYMMDAANEQGFRNEDGQPFTKPADFISAVSTDHHGYYKFYSQAKDYDFAQNPVALMVSPTVARNLLKQSKNPRKLIPAHVDEIAARMRRGTWEPQQSLEFKNGFLVDGQHRLHALIKSGKTYTFPIVANPAVLPTLGTLSLIPGGILASLELHKRFKHRKRKKQATPATPKARNPSEKYLKERNRIDSRERIDSLSRMFQGAASGALVRVPISRHDAGKDLARLGNLRFLRMHQRPASCDQAARQDDGSNGKYHTCRRCTVFFDPRTSYAAMDRDKKIYLAGRGVRRERPAMLQNPDEHVSYGKVDLIGYITSKAHLNDGKSFCYVHPFAEESRRLKNKPELLLDSDGMPRLSGGSYRIGKEGIID